MATSRKDFRLALVLLAGSGAAALGHQILWTRRMTDLIGAGVESSARVFGCFFLGLALGSAAAALLLPRIRRPWRAIGWIELGVAVLCVPALLLPDWTGWIWPALGPERLVGWIGPVVKSVVSVLVIVPPAFLIGLTLPLMTSAVCGPGMRLSTHGIWLYAASTLGGAAGLVLVVGFTLQVAGAVGSMLAMIGINLTVAALCFGRDARSSEGPGRVAVPPLGLPAPVAVHPKWLVLLLAFMSGAGVLALEVLGVEMLNLKAPLAFYPPAAILFCVVLLLALSAAAAPWVARHLGGVEAALPVCLSSAGLAVAAAPLIFMTLTAGQSGIVGHGGSLSRSLLQLGGVTCASLGPAVVLAGTVFPLLLCWGGPTSGNRAGRTLGKLLAVNGLGGIVGAEISYRVLLPGSGIHVALGIVGGCYGVIALGTLFATNTRPVARVVWVLAALSVCGLLTGTTLRRLPLFLRTSTFKVVEVRSGREGTLAIVERPDLGRGMFFDNQYLLGSSKAAPDREREAHLPLLLHPAPKRVAFIGLGTGITAAGALRHDTVASITVLELSALVADAAERHFSDFNRGLCNNPKVRVHVEDGGTYIAAAKNRFEVIIGDLFTPWRPGEARLCSLEQFNAAREALVPGGVFCQWLPMAQLTAEQFEMIAATFDRAFGRAYLFRNHFKTKGFSLALVGFNRSKMDWDIVARRCETERRQGRLGDPVCRHVEGVALLYLGIHQPKGPVPGLINTLGNLRVELGAGRHLLAGDPADYFYGASESWLTFLKRQLEEVGNLGEMPEPLRLCPQVGLLASRWEIGLEMGYPTVAELQRQLMARMPNTILSDQSADWSLWPGNNPGLPAEWETGSHSN